MQMSYLLGLLSNEESHLEIVETKSVVVQPVHIRQETNVLHGRIDLVTAFFYGTLLTIF